MMTSLLSKIRDLANALVRGPKPIKAGKTSRTVQRAPIEQRPAADRTDSAARLGQAEGEQAALEEERVVDLLKKKQSEQE